VSASPAAEAESGLAGSPDSDSRLAEHKTRIAILEAGGEGFERSTRTTRGRAEQVALMFPRLLGDHVDPYDGARGHKPLTDAVRMPTVDRKRLAPGKISLPRAS
jgi:uncharacterized protein YfiM (DUF2279 family)